MAVATLIGVFSLGACLNLSGFPSTADPIPDVATISQNKCYVFGRFQGSSMDHRLGIWLTNLENKNETYISFNRQFDPPEFSRDQEGFDKREKYFQSASISVVEVAPGRYKITHVQLASEKRQLKQEKFNPEFSIKSGQMIYVGDWSGMEAGANQIMINHIDDKYEYTKTGLIAINVVFVGFDYQDSFRL